MNDLPQEKLHEIFNYNPQTGIFLYLERPRHHFESLPLFGWWLTCDLIGKVAGSKSTGGYLRVQIDKKQYLLHRLAWIYHYGYPPHVIDHINGDPSDNRICNLRDVDTKSNGQNRMIGKNNLSGVMGVTWSKASGKWKVTIQVKGRSVHLGYYSDISEAKEVRANADIEHGYHQNHGICTTASKNL